MGRRDCSLIPIEERNIKLNSSYRRIDVHISFIATREEQVGPAVCLLKPGLRFRFGDGLLRKLSFGAERYGIRSSWDWLWIFQRVKILREYPGTIRHCVH